MKQIYDYIVVGAGAGGCPVVARLVEAGMNVLLIEGGPSNDIDSIKSGNNIGDMFSLWGSQYDWKYETTATSNVNNRSISLTQGKVFGGGTSINAMMYVRGSSKDYDRWSSYGNDGWSYKEVLPYFKKSENYNGVHQRKGLFSKFFRRSYHGSDGPLSVIDFPSPSKLTQSIISGIDALKFDNQNFDYNGKKHDGGVFCYQTTRYPDQTRCDTYTAFVKPLERSNKLDIVNKATVTKLIIEDSRVIGVTYMREGVEQSSSVRYEVVLAAGALATPKILMLSGVGDENDLKAAGIEVVHPLSGVGKNLQDHMWLGVGFASKKEIDPPQLLCEAGLFTYAVSKKSSLVSPDLQFFFSTVQFVDPEYQISEPAFTLAPVLARPKSIGYVKLSTKNPDDLPEVNPNYLSHPDDVDVMLKGIEIARKVSHLSTLSDYFEREIAPGSDKVTKEDLTQFIRQSSKTVWHPCGTCKMGIDKDSVVNSRLKVIGLDGIRIADASIMPDITSGNTNAPTIMIGEKAAAMILEDNH